MKKQNCIAKFAAIAVVLCAGLASFAQDKRLSLIPDTTALVVKADFGKLYSSPTFRAIAESGEVSSVRDDLKKIPWNASGTVPDPIIVYAPRMGFRYAVLVESERDSDELEKQTRALYGTRRTIETKQYGIGRMLTVKRTKTDRKTQKEYLKTDAEVLFISPNIAAFGREDYPVDIDFFTKDALSAAEFDSLQNLPGDVVAAGIMRRFPVPASDDPTGLAALVKSGDFTVSEYEPGAASLVLNLECKGDKEAEQAARRIRSFIRIALVTLFSADRSLFKELNKSYTAETSGSRAKLEIRLSKSALDKIRAYYLVDRSILSTAGALINETGGNGK